MPVVDAAEAIASWWARPATNSAPVPTDDQMVAASAPAVLLARVDQAVPWCTAAASGGSVAVALPHRKHHWQQRREHQEPMWRQHRKRVHPVERHRLGRMQRIATADQRQHHFLIQGDRRGLAAPSLPGPIPELLTRASRLGAPMSGRKAMRALSVGCPRAKRLVDLAGWSAGTTGPRPSNGSRASGAQPANSEEAETT